MNKRDATKIAKYVTYFQLKAMFTNAKNNITDWKQVSAVNKGLTKGTAWNILAPSMDGLEVDDEKRQLAIRNMIWEFGDHLPEEAKLDENGKRKKNPKREPYHEDPVF